MFCLVFLLGHIVPVAELTARLRTFGGPEASQDCSIHDIITASTTVLTQQ